MTADSLIWDWYAGRSYMGTFLMISVARGYVSGLVVWEQRRSNSSSDGGALNILAFDDSIFSVVVIV